MAGNIGTGKSTLTRLLAEHYNWRPHYELVEENPYLEDFYRDMRRWSFPLQVCFLNNRFNIHTQIQSGTASAIQDRSIYEDAHIFTRNLYDAGHMDLRDYKNYRGLYEKMITYLRAPDLVVYLRKSTPKLMEHIHKRGRPCEANIDFGYLDHLNRYYEEWIESYTEGRLLVVDSDAMDFVAEPRHFDEIAARIFHELGQQELFHPTAKQHVNG